MAHPRSPGLPGLPSKNAVRSFADQVPWHPQNVLPKRSCPAPAPESESRWQDTTFVGSDRSVHTKVFVPVPHHPCCFPPSYKE